MRKGKGGGAPIGNKNAAGPRNSSKQTLSFNKSGKLLLNNSIAFPKSKPTKLNSNLKPAKGWEPALSPAVKIPKNTSKSETNFIKNLNKSSELDHKSGGHYEKLYGKGKTFITDKEASALSNKTGFKISSKDYGDYIKTTNDMWDYL